MNHALLREAMTLFEQHPSFTTNTAWIDGNKASLAGRIVLLAGAKRATDDMGGIIGRTVIHDGYLRDVPELARELTGLTAMEARYLFNWRRTLAEMRSAVDDITDYRAISGRPYWMDTEADHRYITDQGRIVGFAHRRTAAILTMGTWHEVICPDPIQAARLARAHSRTLGGVPYRFRPLHTRRSITA